MASEPITYTLTTPLMDGERTITSLTFVPRLDIEMVETLVEDIGIKFDLTTGKMVGGAKPSMKDLRRLMAVLSGEKFEVLGHLSIDDWSGIAQVLGPLLAGLSAIPVPASPASTG